MEEDKFFFIANVLDSAHCGWLRAEVTNVGNIEIPFGTKVKLLDSIDDGQIIKIFEGLYKDYIAFIPYISGNANSFYSYLQVWKNLNINKTIKVYKDKIQFDQKIFDIVVDFNYLKPGIYSIKFPIKVKKKLDRAYFDDSKGGSRYADSWFPIYAKNELLTDKFIHFGTYSEGCITVKFIPNNNQSTWNYIFPTLLKSRLNNNTLAKLVVKDISFSGKLHS